MNCANHPEAAVSAYCQNCGKPLCAQCVRSVAGVVYCEPCLAARLHGASAAAGSTAGVPAGSWSAVQDPVMPVGFNRGPSPVLAGLLGILPGVGAMYNGQFIKALMHVLVFIFLVGATDHFALAGILVAAWVVYQIFDSIQTAAARRDGLPLPDPFGLNDLGQRLGVPGGQTVRPVAAYTATPGSTPGAISGAPASGSDPLSSGAMPPWESYPPSAAAGQAAASANPDPSAQPAYPPGFASIPPPAPAPYSVVYGPRPEPIGAIVLIVVGMLFLLSTLGVFEWEWVGRGWPVIIIVIGAAMLFRRVRTTPRTGGGL